MKKTICIIGGDDRNYELANILKEKGDFVKLYEGGGIENFLKGADCVVGGIPFSRDGETVNAPYASEKISVEKLFLSMKDQKNLIGGSFLDKVKASKQGIGFDAAKIKKYFYLG